MRSPRRAEPEACGARGVRPWPCDPGHATLGAQLRSPALLKATWARFLPRDFSCPRPPTPAGLSSGRGWRGLSQHRNEVVTIAGLLTPDGGLPAGVGAALRLSTPALYAHEANAAWQGEVALLSRTVTVQGAAADSEPTDVSPLGCVDSEWILSSRSVPCNNHLTGFGAHIFVAGTTAVAHVAGVELFRVGQTNVLGRCALWRALDPAPALPPAPPPQHLSRPRPPSASPRALSVAILTPRVRGRAIETPDGRPAALPLDGRHAHRCRRWACVRARLVRAPLLLPLREHPRNEPRHRLPDGSIRCDWPLLLSRGRRGDAQHARVQLGSACPLYRPAPAFLQPVLRRRRTDRRLVATG